MQAQGQYLGLLVGTGSESCRMTPAVNCPSAAGGLAHAMPSGTDCRGRRCQWGVSEVFLGSLQGLHCSA